MKIKVTKKHIEDGDIDNSSFCPIALAIKCKTTCRIYVDLDNVYIDFEKHELPKSAQKFISDFDLAHNSKRIKWRKSMIETAYIGHIHFLRKPRKSR